MTSRYKKIDRFFQYNFQFKLPHSQFSMIAKTLYYLAFIIEQLLMEGHIKVVENRLVDALPESARPEQSDPSANQVSSTPIDKQEEEAEKASNCELPVLPVQPTAAQLPLQQSTPSLSQNLQVANCKEDQQNEEKSQVQNNFSHQQINQDPNNNLLNQIKPDLNLQEVPKTNIQITVVKNPLRAINSKKKKNQKNYSYDDEDNSEAIQTFKFPFVNEYLRQHCQQYLYTLQKFDKVKEAQGKIVSDTFINLDVRYFNWKLFVEEVGKFEVVLIDPPWRIKGAQQNDSQFMFSNCKFSLEYNTMANSEIGRIPLHLLSDQGFIFLWILNSQLDSSIEIMEGWGYELVEEVIWVKLKDQKISLTHGYYFMHSYQVCLIGYKCKNGIEKAEKMKIRHGISWNTFFAEVREKSQKPQDLYALVDIMFKGGKKIQIFARNHNLRFGVFSMGNQLGESYDKWMLKLQCDECGGILQSGCKRFKSKIKPNYDLCQKCIGSKDKATFFQLANDVDQNVRHQYVSCNHCGSEPIWGIRFQCITCQDFDICQNCFDKNLHSEHNFHSLDHQYLFLEVPVFGNGFHIHQSKCSSCYQNPIIGIYFSCSTCKSFKMCQKCYFERPPTTYSNFAKRHKPDHQLQLDKKYECFGCKREILENCWMCENCYNFFFCEKCFQNKNDFKSLYANTHKKYHVLTKIF